LCLDCEELHVSDACPVCASTHYAFLSAWLPSEERRRWRRQPPRIHAAPRGVRALFQKIGRWLAIGEAPDEPVQIRTRKSDHVPQFDLDPNAETTKPAVQKPTLEPKPAQAWRHRGH
jgi:hypothetical protein